MPLAKPMVPFFRIPGFIADHAPLFYSIHAWNSLIAICSGSVMSRDAKRVSLGAVFAHSVIHIGLDRSARHPHGSTPFLDVSHIEG